MIPHRQLVLYTGNTFREETIHKESWFFNLRANSVQAVVSDNALIDEYLIAPLIYHHIIYTPPPPPISLLHFRCHVIDLCISNLFW